MPRHIDPTECSTVQRNAWEVTQSSRGGWVTRLRVPPLADHREGATMVQGGLYRGVAVCKGVPGLPVDQPTPGLAIAYSVPQPIHRVFLHRCIMGWGPHTRTWGHF